MIARAYVENPECGTSRILEDGQYRILGCPVRCHQDMTAQFHSLPDGIMQAGGRIREYRGLHIARTTGNRKRA
jgi:hypothetical protein